MKVYDIIHKFPQFKDILKGMPDDIELYIEKFQPSTIIVQKGDNIEKVMMVSSGDMIVYNEYESGEVIYVRSQGVTFIGDIELLSKSKQYVCSVVSKNECSAIVMSCSDYLRWFNDDHNLAREIAVRLANRNCKQAQSIGALKYQNTNSRIIKYLIELVKDKLKTENSVTIKMTRQALACNVGASERMVHRIIKQMREYNYITTGYGCITITREQSKKLEKLTEV